MSPSSSSPSDPQPKRSRTKGVIVLTSVLTLLVMGGVILLGLRARRSDAGGRSGVFGARAGFGDPYRNVPWDDEGCEPDRAHPPKLVFELPPEGLDFGSVKQGVALNRDIVFKNEGSGPLCIREVASGCGCIQAVLATSKKIFHPGESGKIQIMLDTKGREGKVVKTISIYTNSLDEPRVSFTVKASISVGLIAWPLNAYFRKVLKGESSTLKVRLRSADGDTDWNVTGVHGRVEVEGSTVPYTYEIVPMKDANQRVLDVIVTHPGRDVEGPFQDTLVIETTHPDRPEVIVVAHLPVVPPIMAYPSHVAFGYLPAPSRKIRIRLLPGTKKVAFEVTGVRFEPVGGDTPRRGSAGFDATWGKGAEESWHVDVVYDGVLREPGKLRALMIVETTLPEMPEVDVEVSAQIRK